MTDFKGDERFQCDQCELKFSYYAALLRHLDARHKTFDANRKIQEINKKAVSCDQCGATLSSKGALHGKYEDILCLIFCLGTGATMNEASLFYYVMLMISQCVGWGENPPINTLAS